MIFEKELETEKLVERFCFSLTISQAFRRSTIANHIKNFMVVLFPEWYRPEVASMIVTFNNYKQFDSMVNLTELSEPLTFKCEYQEKPVYLSAKSGFKLFPFSIEHSFINSTETLTHMYFNFKSHVKVEDNLKYKKVNIYLHSTNPEDIFTLLYYIFDPRLKDKNCHLTMDGKTIEINRKAITLPMHGLTEETQNVFFDSKNKLTPFLEVLNKLHHYFYIEIDLGYEFQLNTGDFKLYIPLHKQAHADLPNLKNFAHTNCIPVFDIYKDNIRTLSINNEDTEINKNVENKIKIATLEDHKLVHILSSRIYDLGTEESSPLPSDMFLESEIQFSPTIPFNIEHKLVLKKNARIRDSYLWLKGMRTQLLKDSHTIVGSALKTKDHSNMSFGNILTEPSHTIFYCEILSDPEFFNFIYNWNHFLGKKMDNLEMLSEYLAKIRHLFFNYKETFFKYFDEIKVIKWKMVARMSDECKPLIISRYTIKASDNKAHYLYDRMLEKILTHIAETDLVYEIVRV